MLKENVTKKDDTLEKKVEALLSFLDSFSRVFKIGIYYPLGHVVLDQAANKAIKKLREVVVKGEELRIEINSGGIILNDFELPASNVAVEEMSRLFYALGLQLIELDFNLTHKEFLHFVKAILNWRAELETSSGLIQFNIGELPTTIKVEQRQFLVDEGAVVADGAETGNREQLEGMCNALLVQGLNEGQVDQCRTLLLDLSKPQKEKKVEIKGYPNATWKDVQNLLHKIIVSAHSETEGQADSVANNEVNVISSILTSLEKGLSDGTAKDTVQLLLTHLKGSAEQKKIEEEKKRTQKKPPPAKIIENLVSVKELNAYIYENNIPLPVLEQIISVDRSEELAILLQLLGPEKNVVVLKIIYKKILGILLKPLTPREQKILIAGIKSFADAEKFNQSKKLLTVVLSAMRAAEKMDSLLFVVKLWTKMPYNMHMMLWPYVLNELLMVGTDGDVEAFQEATEIASHMHESAMMQMLGQLERMDAFKKKMIAAEIFKSSNQISFPLFGFLMGTSIGAMVSEKVLAALQERPPDTLLETVGPMLNLQNPEHVKFLHFYLLEGRKKEVSPELRIAAGDIAASFILQANEEQKASPWMEKSIVGLSELKVKSSRKVLEYILREKKLGLVPLWSRSCRKAAGTALKMVKKNKLVG